MKYKTFFSAAMISVPASIPLSTAGMLPTAALCAMLTAGSAMPVAAAGRTDLFGDPVPPGSGYRTIVITPDTRHINVTGGEVINFVVNGKTFSWSFFVAQQIRSFALDQVAPPGMLDHPVTAHIAPDPRYWGRG